MCMKVLAFLSFINMEKELYIRKHYFIDCFTKIFRAAACNMVLGYITQMLNPLKLPHLY